MKKKVWRDPIYGNDRRRARQYWNERLRELGPERYMHPTPAELEDAEDAYRLDSLSRGRVRPADKDAPDLMVYGEGAQIVGEQILLTMEIAVPTIGLSARSLECRQEVLDRYFRKPGSEENQQFQADESIPVAK